MRQLFIISLLTAAWTLPGCQSGLPYDADPWADDDLLVLTREPANRPSSSSLTAEAAGVSEQHQIGLTMCKSKATSMQPITMTDVSMPSLMLEGQQLCWRA